MTKKHFKAACQCDSTRWPTLEPWEWSRDQILDRFATNQKMHIWMKYNSDFKKFCKLVAKFGTIGIRVALIHILFYLIIYYSIIYYHILFKSNNIHIIYFSIWSIFSIQYLLVALIHISFHILIHIWFLIHILFHLLISIQYSVSTSRADSYIIP